MAFKDNDTIDTNSWCSPKDCTDYLFNLDDHLDNDLELLQASIRSSTAIKRSILRRRFLDGMPFSESSPPYDIRHNVAVCAVFFAVRSHAYSVGSHEGLLEAMEEACKRSTEFFEKIASGEINLEPTKGVKNVSAPHYTPKPSGDYGFDKN